MILEIEDPHKNMRKTEDRTNMYLRLHSFTQLKDALRSLTEISLVVLSRRLLIVDRVNITFFPPW